MNRRPGILLLGCCCSLLLSLRVEGHTHHHAPPAQPAAAQPAPMPEHHDMADHAEHHADHGDSSDAASQKPPLILVIFDGLRHDYLELYKARGLNLSSFEWLARQGVRARHVRPVYPTETMPNHQSLMTGLYPESHGILFNKFADSARPGRVFSMDDQASLNDPDWYSGFPEPLWLTNQRQGGRSAVVLYPNADAAYGGMRPYLQIDQYIILNGEPAIYPHEARVDRLLNWLSNPAVYGHISLALLYFDQPDAAAHAHGPVSDSVGAQLAGMDRMLGRLLDGLRGAGLLDSVNLIVTADHGMAAVDPSKVIDLSPQLPADFYSNPFGARVSCHVALAPRGGLTPAQLAERLNSISGVRAYEAAGLPAELRLAGCPRRLPPVLACVDPPGLIRLNASFPVPLGAHGYPANSSDMRPLWLAWGPAFKRGGFVLPDPVESVDFYPLACHLLGIRPNPNNGSLARISGVLAPALAAAAPVSAGFFATFAGVLILFALFCGVLLGTACFTAARRGVRTVCGEFQ